MWPIHEATYQTYYCYGAKIKIRPEITRIISGTGEARFNMKFGVTAASINGGLGTPTMSTATNDHWADGNLTKSAYFNFNSASETNNTLEMYCPITAF